MKVLLLLILFFPGIESFCAKANDRPWNDLSASILKGGYHIVSKDSVSIQAGAFKKKSNAESLVSSLKGISGLRVMIVFDSGFYKVRVAVGQNGKFPDEKDTFKLAIRNGFMAAPNDEFPYQVAAFRDKINAYRFVTRLELLEGIKAKVVFEGGFYKIRIAIPSDESLSTDIDKPLNPISPVSDTVLKEKVPDSKGAAGIRLDRKNYFGKPEKLIKAIILTTVITVTGLFMLILIIVLHRYRLERKQQRDNDLMERYQVLIVDYLFGNKDTSLFMSALRKKYSRQILIDQIIDVSINLKGDERNNLISLYNQLGLHKDSRSKAADYRWHKKIKGFRELAFMNISVDNGLIYNALNSGNGILRMEAQTALVRLSSDNHFEFLSYLRKPFSLWEQIVLHDLIIQHNISVPPFRRWLTSPNDSVVMFSLRMIREFRQTDAEDAVIMSLFHQSADVRTLAVQVSGDLGFRSTVDALKKMYRRQDYNTSVEIIRALGKMSDPSILEFLKHVFEEEENLQLGIEAARAIEQTGMDGVKVLDEIMNYDENRYKTVISHVLDRRIN